MIGFQIFLFKSGTSGTLGIIYDALTFVIYSNTATFCRIKLLIEHLLFALLCRIFIIPQWAHYIQLDVSTPNVTYTDNFSLQW